MPIFPSRVAEIAGVGGLKLGNYYATANPGGPAGSALMTMFTVCTFRRIPVGNDYLFQRFTTGGGDDGWAVIEVANGYRFYVANSTPAYVIVTQVLTASMINIPLILVARYNAGTLQGWQNGVNVGTTVLGAGYSSAGASTRIGTDSAGAGSSPDVIIHEAGMLDGYDCAATIATLNAQWTDDLQQGRSLTWPRAAVAGSDWYWSARDAALGLGGCVPTWTDRYSGVAMTRTGTPQSASVPGRLA